MFSWLTQLRSRLPRVGIWPRLLVAGTFLLLAVASALEARGDKPAAPTGVATVVASRDLPAGHVVRRHDVRTVRWPPGLRPPNARASASQVLGRRLAGPLGAHEAITESRLVGAGLADGLAAGLVAAPLPLGDAHAVDLVRVGDRVDVLETARPSGIEAQPPTARPRVVPVATSVLVLAVLPGRADSDAELIVAVDRDTAARIARDGSSQVFTALVVAP